MDTDAPRAARRPAPRLRLPVRTQLQVVRSLKAAPLAVAVLVLARSDAVRAEDEPVFEGRPELTRYTKEVALEMTGSLMEDGPAVGAGATISAFYNRWLASFAGATYSPSFAAPRERWEARAGSRLIYPEPLFGGVFGYVLGGAGVLFTAASEREETYHRALTGIAGVGFFGNVSSHVRLRLELREHLLLFGKADSWHAATAGLSIIWLTR